MKRALVVGGTGPSGPLIVEGLLDRDYHTTIFHSGRHEVTFSRPVDHIHGDAHFPDTIASALGDKRYDLVVAMYGRLRHVAEWARGHVERLVAVTGAAGYASRADNRWGPLGRDLLPDERGPWEHDDSLFHGKIHVAEEVVLDHAQAGWYQATILRPPNMYGPRQIAPEEWSVVRRILDGRSQIIIADNGLKVEARIHVTNFAAALLTIIDSPNITAGQRYNVRDRDLYTIRQRIELIARALDAEVELVNLPFDLASPIHPLWRHTPLHNVFSDDRIRGELGHRDVISAGDAIMETARLLAANPLPRGGEAEQQLGDPFDYAREDALLEIWGTARRVLQEEQIAVPPAAHRYRHPQRPDEDWMRRSGHGYRPGA